MIRKFIYSLGIIAIMGVLLTPRVEAGTLKLRLSDDGGTTWTTVADGSGADANVLPGVVTFIGSVGTNWVLNVTTGVSDPFVTATSSFAYMDLNSINATSTGAGSLLIQLTLTDFPAFPSADGFLQGIIGGTVNSDPGSTLDAWAYINESNAEFDITSPEASIQLGQFSSGGFTQTVFDSHGPLNTYSMTIVTLLTHTGAGLTSYDFEVMNTVPVPTGVMLLGMGAPLLGAGYWMRRRRVAVA